MDLSPLTCLKINLTISGPCFHHRGYFSPSFQLPSPPPQDKGHCRSHHQVFIKEQKEPRGFWAILCHTQRLWHGAARTVALCGHPLPPPLPTAHPPPPRWLKLEQHEVSLSNSRTNCSLAFPFTFPQTPILTCPHSFPHRAWRHEKHRPINSSSRH